MRIDDETLAKLLREGESFRVEFKESVDGSAPRAIREAVCAFANDLPGSGEPGVVFVGVRDNREPVGLTVTGQVLTQLSDIKTDGNIVPPPALLVEKRILHGWEVAIVTVLPSDSPPVRFRGNIHVRSGPRRGIATAQDERILNEKRRALDIPFDIWPVSGSGIADLSLRRFEEEYLPRAFSPEALEANERSVEQQLAATKMIVSADDPRATVLGVLTLGKQPRRFVESAYIQFLRIDGVEWSDPIVDEQVIEGTLSEVLQRSDDKLKAHIQTRVDFTSSDLEQRTATYPLEALQQITRNAVMHRAYERTNAPVRITWFSDRIEVLSPGGAFGLVTSETFGQPGVVDYRNPNLAEALRALGYVQRFGVGIATARRRLADNGNPEPEFEINDAFVTAVIRKRKLRDST